MESPDKGLFAPPSAPRDPVFVDKGWPDPPCRSEGFLPCMNCKGGCFYHDLPYDPETGHGRLAAEAWDGDGHGSATLADPWEEERAELGPPPAVALNKDQRGAVEHTAGPALVVAGAGSGKTRVLVTRVRRLVEDLHVPASSVLAVTFTRKAAGEMKSRLGTERRYKDLTVSTFHGLALALCREHPSLVDRRGIFSVWDESIAAAEMRRILREVWADVVVPTGLVAGTRNSSGDMPSSDAIQKFVGRWKRLAQPLSGRRFLREATSEVHWAAVTVLREYETLKQASNAMDFDDFIWRAVWMLEHHPEIRDRLRDRWQYLLVDEYQDTNDLQERFLHLLIGSSRNVMVVGDEDQSIYAFNGANVDHILTFPRRFPGAQVYTLGQNYRSSVAIVEAAARVIARNHGRRPKQIWTDNDRGWPVEYLKFTTPISEAEHIAAMIGGSIEAGYAPAEHAVLVRLRRQIPVIQLALLNKKIPHHTVGYIELHQRADVKLLLAWMRCFVSPNDFVSGAICLRNWPKIGAGTVAQWQEACSTNNDPVFAHLGFLLGLKGCGAHTQKGQSILAFRDAWKEFERLAYNGASIYDLACWLYAKTGLDAEIDDGKNADSQSVSDDAQRRDSFRTAFLASCPKDQVENPYHRITAYLDALSTNAKRSDKEPTVRISTTHSAKGLEFDHVWVAGCVESIFPCHRNSEEDEAEEDVSDLTSLDAARDDIEEERRLMYVAMTRARHRLVLCHFEVHQVKGVWEQCRPSRFLVEANTDPPAAHMLREDPFAAPEVVGPPPAILVTEPDPRPWWQVMTPEEEADARASDADTNDPGAADRGTQSLFSR